MKKVCKKCGVELSIDNCIKKKYRSGNIGIAGICKRCENAKRKAKYKPVIRENDKLYKEGKRRCKKCSVIKPLSEYSRYTAKKGGIKNVCNECERIRYRDWKRENADRVNEGRRERIANDPEYRDRINGNKNQWRIDNREHHLKMEREGAKRRYRENPELREKLKKKGKIRSRIRYYENRRQCIDKLGGKCIECGVTENLQFDHINPLEKSFAISETLHFSPKMKKDVKFDEELNKCQLLCPTCHLEKTKNDFLNGIYNRKTFNLDYIGYRGTPSTYRGT